MPQFINPPVSFQSTHSTVGTNLSSSLGTFSVGFTASKQQQDTELQGQELLIPSGGAFIQDGVI